MCSLLLSNQATVIHLTLIIVFCSLCCNYYATEARLLSAQEQAIGKWNLTVKKKNGKLFDSIFYGLAPVVSRKNNQSATVSSFLEKIKLLKSKDDECGVENNNQQFIWELKDDGTFSLSPASHSSQLTESTPSSLVNGRWNLDPTRYCITDRFYDELSGCSFSRARSFFIPKSSNTNASDDKDNESTRSEMKNGNVVVERAVLEFRCKLWGRYFAPHPSISQFLSSKLHPRCSINNKNKGVGRARMTHGTILLIRSGSNRLLQCKKWQYWKRRVVLGTFKAEIVETKNYNDEFDVTEEGKGQWVYEKKQWRFKTH